MITRVTYDKGFLKEVFIKDYDIEKGPYSQQWNSDGLSGPTVKYEDGSWAYYLNNDIGRVDGPAQYHAPKNQYVWVYNKMDITAKMTNWLSDYDFNLTELDDKDKIIITMKVLSICKDR